MTYKKIIFNQEMIKEREFLLEKVSRTFNFSIKILPYNLKQFVGHSYLICRFLDTLEDTPSLTILEKNEALDKAILSIQEAQVTKENKEYFRMLASNAKMKIHEATILQKADEIMKEMKSYPQAVLEIIQKWTIEMARGMKKYAFGKDRPKTQLKTISELEEYTYFVAGTVGKLLTEIFSIDQNYSLELKNRLDKYSIAFGKALQYVNIIKDSRADILEGRCFIPLELFQANELTIEDFINKTKIEKTVLIYNQLIKQAQAYLDDAVSYILLLPRFKSFKLRLFCIWPVILAYKTLLKIEKNLDLFVKSDSTIKITREEVKKSVRISSLGAFSNFFFKKYIKDINKGK